MMNKFNRRTGLFTGLCLVAIAMTSMGLADENKVGAIKGRVIAPDGQPAVGAVVRLVISGPMRAGANTDGASRGKSSGLGLEQLPIQLAKGESVIKVTKTDNAGNYEMKQVAVGKYSVVTNQTARFKAARQGVEVGENQTATVDIKLEAR